MGLITTTTAQTAADYLGKVDPILKPVIAQAGLCTIRPHQDYYQTLVDSIISQQLSVHAARSIEKRFQELFGGSFPSANQILTTDVETLRGLGFSRPKARYVLDLAQHVVDGSVVFDDLDTMTNDEVIQKLTVVKGIGEWTAHMFLMFCMGRTDILATGDLGIRNGVRKLYDLPDPPTPEAIQTLAKERKWHPYESIACWYIWHSLDNAPAV